MTLSFIPLGVGDAFSAVHWSTCFAVQHDDARLLIDCPHPIRRVLRESANLDVGDFDAVLVTHLHADHASGLEGFGYFTHFALRRRAVLYAHGDVLARLWDGHLAAGMERLIDAHAHQPRDLHLHDYFDVRPLQPTTTIGPFTIEHRLTIHHVPTTALRITAGGATLGYSADTAYDPTLIDWLSSADVIVHETNYGAHTPYAKLAALPAALRAKMRLVHYPDEFDVEGSVIECLREGRRYDVSRR